MPQEQSQYKYARKQRKLKEPPVMEPSDKKTLTPKYLLEHQNHFDPNVYTPGDMIDRGVSKGKRSQRTDT